MKLKMALEVAKQMCDQTHPATVSSKQVCPNLCMVLANNGQYLTSQRVEGYKKAWTFEEFVKQFGN